MERRRLAQVWFGATAVVASFALIAQLILVIVGASVLVAEDPPTLGERLLRLVSYFTIQSNVAVLLAVLPLARDPEHDTGPWRVLRLTGLIGIVITGVVHWFLLRPLLDLTGWSYATDKLLHVAVPLLALVGWLAFGPRPRITGRVVGLALIWPIAWLVYTLIMGAATGWYPYPFINVEVNGAGRVAVACTAIALAFFAFSGLAWLADRRMAPTRADVSA